MSPEPGCDDCAVVLRQTASLGPILTVVPSGRCGWQIIAAHENDGQCLRIGGPRPVEDPTNAQPVVWLVERRRADVRNSGGVTGIVAAEGLRTGLITGADRQAQLAGNGGQTAVDAEAASLERAHAGNRRRIRGAIAGAAEVVVDDP